MKSVVFIRFVPSVQYGHILHLSYICLLLHYYSENQLYIFVDNLPSVC